MTNEVWPRTTLLKTAGPVFVDQVLPAGAPRRTAATVGSRKLLKLVVGARGFEPPTSRSRTERSTRLSHAPTRIDKRFYGSIIRVSNGGCNERRLVCGYLT